MREKAGELRGNAGNYEEKRVEGKWLSSPVRDVLWDISNQNAKQSSLPELRGKAGNYEEKRVRMKTGL
ncbi:hypothetical protein JYT20_00145 [Rhodothermus sp. AH-315-K08]|nr:hypothetical protein [Rhodothermus sp. AH-315-K08]